jgi:phosphatidylglycerol---prolipoprotein diacylglyceryl transferase
MTITLAAWLHTIDPFAIKFPDWSPLAGIRWYGLSYLLGFVLGYFLIRRVVRVGVSTLKPAEVGDFIVWAAIGVVVGGRLGYCVFYQPRMFITFTSSPPWWDALAINKGGMASHGGMIGGVIACWLYARTRKHSLPHLIDLAAFGTPIGMFFGRLANFVNGELLGRPCSPDLPWAVKFPQELRDRAPQELFNLTPAVKALGIEPQQWTNALAEYWTSNSAPGFVHAGVEKIITAIQSGNQQVAHLVAPLLTPRHPSQIYQAITGGLLVFVVLLIVWARPRKPLVLGGAYLTAYAVARFFSEFFREPDAHLRNREFAYWHITRGQLLSIVAFVAGVTIVVIFSRRKAAPMGGWLKRGGDSGGGRGDDQLSSIRGSTQA